MKVRYHFLSSILARIITLATLILFVPIVVFATGSPGKEIKTEKEIKAFANLVTVKIYRKKAEGSGFIIAKKGNTYTVATANHVFDDKSATYHIHTYDGKEYQATIVNLQKKDNIDVAIATFESTESYQVATLSDSCPDGKVYVSGYLYGDIQFTSGGVTNSKSNCLSMDEKENGYNLNYGAPTAPGMSGGPVFDEEERVVAIHAEGITSNSEVKGITKSFIGSIGSAEMLTGFNVGIPINIFLKKISENGLDPSGIVVDKSPVNPNLSPNLNHPNDAKSYYLRGLTKLDQGDLDGAIADFNEAIQKQSDYDADAYFYQGIAYLYKGDLPNSMTDFNQAITLNASYTNAYFNRALIHQAMGDKKSAIDDYNQVIRLDGYLAEAYNNRGLIFSSLGYQERAINDFTKALEINPVRANTYYNRGLAFFRSHQYQQALADYTQAIIINPNYAKAYASRGETLLRMEYQQEAIANLQKAANLFQAQGMNEDAKKALEIIEQLQK